jgi:Holliday junction resolvase RusA-like endonuclease
MIVTFIIEGEPQGKGRHRTTKTGHTYTPQKTLLYENWIKTCYLSRAGEKMLQGPIKASIEAYYTIPKSKSKNVKAQMEKGIIRPVKKPDVDNIAKAVFDSLNGIAYKDDAQVVELSMSKYYAENGFVKVMLEEMEPGGETR